MIRYCALLFVAVCALGQVPTHTPHYPHTSNATVLYGAMGTMPYNLVSGANTWLGQRFDLILGGGGPCYQYPQPPDLTPCGDAHGGNLTQTYWANYTDIAVALYSGLYTMQIGLVANAMQLEGSLLHSSIDMQWPPGIALVNIGRFDTFESPEPLHSNLVQGIFTCSGAACSGSTSIGTYTDVTQTFYNNGIPITISDTAYFGYQVPFDQANFTVTVPSGKTVAFNYWNGTSWVPFSSHFSDTTTGLTTNGKVSWYPDSSWVPRTLPVNVTSPQAITTTHSKYWLQVVVTGGGTAPIISTALTEDWAIASGSNNARGWDGTASGRINIGTMVEYNPAPPSISTAKFKYQGRVPVTNLGQNYFWFNPSNTQSGQLSGAVALQALLDAFGAGPPPDNFDASFFDDGTRYPGSSGGPIYPATNWLTYMDFTHGGGADLGFINEQLNMFNSAYTLLKAEPSHGTNYLVGSNSAIPGNPTGPNVGQFVLNEGFTTPFAPGYCGYLALLFEQCQYDSALTVNNAQNAKWYFQSIDGWDYQFPWYGGNYTYWHYADHGNRTPMSVLAQNYIGANANTGFMYFGTSACNASCLNFYFNVDQVYTYGQQLSLTAPITADPTGSAKTISLSNSNNCIAGTNSIGLSMFRIGTKSSGDIVGGSLGHVYNFGGGEDTVALRAGDIPTRSGAFPQNIFSGDVAKFGSLVLTFQTPVVAGTVTWQYWNGTAFAPLTVTDGTANFSHNGTITWTPPADWAIATTFPEPMYGFPITVASGYYVVATTYNPYALLTLYSGEWKTLKLPAEGASTTSNIYNNYSIGDPVYCVPVQHLSTGITPSASNVYAWSRWFPAMATDVGIPNVSGVGGGVRMVNGPTIAGLALPPWKANTPGSSPSNISGQASCPSSGPLCSDLWRRDFTRAIIFYRPWAGPGTTTPVLESELDTYSKPFCVTGTYPSCTGTYYPLLADGSTGAGVSSLQIRAGEGAILMTSPVVTTSNYTGTYKGTIH